MKKVLLILLLITQNIFAMDTLVQLPEKDTIIDRFNTLYLLHFVEHSDLVSSLAGKEKSVQEVSQTVEETVRTYLESVHANKNGMLEFYKSILENAKPQMYEALLQDNPEALEVFEQHVLETKPEPPLSQRFPGLPKEIELSINLSRQKENESGVSKRGLRYGSFVGDFAGSTY